MVWWFISVWLSNHNTVYAACHRDSALRQTFVLAYSLLLKPLKECLQAAIFSIYVDIRQTFPFVDVMVKRDQM